MVKKLFLLLLLSGAFCLAGKETAGIQGRVWIIRHGQRDTVKAPDYDPALTPAGRRQAELAAAYLKKMKFSGRICASPYRRTLETASIIAKALDRQVYITPFLQEFVRFPGVHPVRERSLAALKKEFPLLAEQPELPRNWAIRNKETLEDVRIRLHAGLQQLSLVHDSEVLLVTHGAVLKAAHMLATGRSGTGKWEKMNWNCCISAYDFSSPAPPRIRLFFEVGFLPEELVTSNERYLLKKKNQAALPVQADPMVKK